MNQKFLSTRNILFLPFFFVMIFLIILNSYVVILTHYYSQSSTCKPRSFKVYDNKHAQVGIITGSVHNGLTEKELKPSIDFLSQYLEDTQNIYLEVDKEHIPRSNDGFTGLEAAFIDILEDRAQVDKIFALEHPLEQHQIFADLYQIGPNTYSLPLKKLYAVTPVGAQLIRQYNRILLFPINFLYSAIINPQFSSTTQTKQINILNAMKKNFLANQTGTAESQDIMNLRLSERDLEMFKKLQSHQQISKGHFILILGQLHLANDNGILSLFNKAGSELEPIEL